MTNQTYSRAFSFFSFYTILYTLREIVLQSATFSLLFLPLLLFYDHDFDYRQKQNHNENPKSKFRSRIKNKRTTQKNQHTHRNTQKTDYFINQVQIFLTVSSLK